MTSSKEISVNTYSQWLSYLAVVSLGISSVICVYLHIKENLAADYMLSYEKFVPKPDDYYPTIKQLVYSQKNSLWLNSYAKWLSFLGVIASLIVILHLEFKKKWFWWALIISLISINIFSDNIDVFSSCLIFYLLFRFHEFRNDNTGELRF